MTIIWIYAVAAIVVSGLSYAFTVWFRDRFEAARRAVDQELLSPALFAAVSGLLWPWTLWLWVMP